jgi:uncharacterized protein DUF3168
VSAPTYGAVDVALKLWLLSSDVAPLVKQPSGAYAVHMAMPKSSPVPSIIINLVSGGPLSRADLPATRYRISFDCWGTTRDEASLIARTVIDLLEQISVGNTGILAAGVWLGAAENVSMRWLPDPESDTPRYIVDALITTVA